MKWNIVIKNHLFLFRLVNEASRYRILIQLSFAILKSAVSFLSSVFLVRVVLNTLSLNEKIEKMIMILVVISIIYLIFIVSNSWYENVYLPISNNKITNHLQKKLFEKASNVNIENYESTEYYDSYIKALDRAPQVCMDVLNYISSVVGSLSFVLFSGVLIFSISYKILLVLMFPLLIGGVVSKLSTDENFNLYEKNIRSRRIKDYVFRVFYIGKYKNELKTSNVSSILFSNYKLANTNIKKNIKMSGKKLAILQYLFYVSNEILSDFIIFVYASYSVLVVKTMLLGDFFVIIDSLGDIAWSLKEVVGVFSSSYSNTKYISNIKAFLENNQTDSSNIGIIKELKEPIKAIEFINVSYSYNSKKEEAINNISFRITEGQKIVIVGENGAGKSTLIKLIGNLYKPTKGKILINNNEINSIYINDYKQKVSVIPQNIELFELSVSENILSRKADSNKDIKDIHESLKKVNLDSKIKNLKQGMYSIIGKDIFLSGGEQQKISIARLLIEDKEIIILDEPSSALDPFMERELYEIISKIFEKKIVVFISHRLTSAVLANKVIYMEKGKIVESGTHDELMNISNGKYSLMFKQQSKEYLN